MACSIPHGMQYFMRRMNNRVDNRFAHADGQHTNFFDELALRTGMWKDRASTWIE